MDRAVKLMGGRALAFALLASAIFLALGRGALPGAKAAERTPPAGLAPFFQPPDKYRDDLGPWSFDACPHYRGQRAGVPLLRVVVERPPLSPQAGFSQGLAHVLVAFFRCLERIVTRLLEDHAAHFTTQVSSITGLVKAAEKAHVINLPALSRQAKLHTSAAFHRIVHVDKCGVGHHHIQCLLQGHAAMHEMAEIVYKLDPRTGNLLDQPHGVLGSVDRLESVGFDGEHGLALPGHGSPAPQGIAKPRLHLLPGLRLAAHGAFHNRRSAGR